VKPQPGWGVLVGQKGRQRLIPRFYASIVVAGKEADLWSDATVVPLMGVDTETKPVKHLPVPRDFAVKVLRTAKQKARAKDVATCGTCGRSWDDGISTGMTPTPSGRCPFEYFHAEVSE
jgi:hypothetical protein